MSDDATRVMPVPGGATADRTLVAPAGFGATQQMPAGLGAPQLGDAMRTQMGGTTTCPICKSTTPLMETYCGECGFLLSSPAAPDLEVPIEEAPAAELIDLTDGRRHRLHAGVNTVGRQGTDVLVNEGTVSRVHARITIDPANGNITVEDLGSSNGTKVGTQRLSANQPTPATPGTELKFGNWRVTLERGGSTSAPATIMGGAEATVALNQTGAADRTIDRTIVGTPAINSLNESLNPAATLQSPEPAASHQSQTTALLQKTQGPGVDIALTASRVTVGRRPDNTIVVTQDSYISGRHAEIITDNGEIYITDLGSTNGTLVNGQKLTPQERQLLLEGDEVQLGQTRYAFLPAPFIPAQPHDAQAEPAETAHGGDEPLLPPLPSLTEIAQANTADQVGARPDSNAP